MWRNWFVTIPDPLPLTGERTVPGADREQYWFARHEVVYRWLVEALGSRGGGLPAGSVIVDAGCGEGYGAEMLRSACGAPVGCTVLAVDYDDITVSHVRAAYPKVRAVRGNLDALPCGSASVAAVVSLQVIEHLWDLGGFLHECHRVLRPGGVIVVSTPNRPVFSPGLSRGAKPTNPFHVEEFDAEQVHDLLVAAGFASVEVHGVDHTGRIAKWEATHGSVVAAHIEAVQTGVWPTELDELLGQIDLTDFAIGPVTPSSQDLIGVAVRT